MYMEILKEVHKQHCWMYLKVHKSSISGLNNMLKFWKHARQKKKGRILYHLCSSARKH